GFQFRRGGSQAVRRGRFGPLFARLGVFLGGVAGLLPRLVSGLPLLLRAVPVSGFHQLELHFTASGRPFRRRFSGPLSPCIMQSLALPSRASSPSDKIRVAFRKPNAPRERLTLQTSRRRFSEE